MNNKNRMNSKAQARVNDSSLPQQLVVATGNSGKVHEIKQALRDFNIELRSQADFEIDSAKETGLSFVENALIKARHASAISGLPTLADDSGLEVDYLNGEPGIYSARYAGENATDQDNNAKLIAQLGNTIHTMPSARFYCALVFLRHANDPTPIICEASWEGSITSKGRGGNGFGYDPIFLLHGTNTTAAELDADQKNSNSHRGKALQQLVHHPRFMQYTAPIRGSHGTVAPTQ